MDFVPDIPAFSTEAKLTDFRVTAYPNWDAAYRSSRGGFYGRVVAAQWLPPGGYPCCDVILKLMIGQTADGGGGETSLSKFNGEVDVLKQVRQKFDATRSKRLDGTDDPSLVGLAHLTFTFCTGSVESAAAVLPTHAPPGAPLYFIAMEPLMGGSLWDRIVVSNGPLPRDAAWRDAKGLFAALAALHALGFAHGDLK